MNQLFLLLQCAFKFKQFIFPLIYIPYFYIFITVNIDLPECKIKSPVRMQGHLICLSYDNINKHYRNPIVLSEVL